MPMFHACTLSSPNIYNWEFIESRLASLNRGRSSAKVYFIRHGETELNQAGLVSGTLDTRLTERGRSEARNLKLELSNAPDLVIASDLTRTWETASLFLDANGYRRPIHRDKRISEVDLGLLQGKPRVDVPAYAAGDIDYAPTGGESYRAAARRIASFIVDVNDIALKQSLDTICIFTHAGALRILTSFFRREVVPREIFKVQSKNLHVLSARISELEIHKQWMSPDEIV